MHLVIQPPSVGGIEFETAVTGTTSGSITTQAGLLVIVTYDNTSSAFTTITVDGVGATKHTGSNNGTILWTALVSAGSHSIAYGGGGSFKSFIAAAYAGAISVVSPTQTVYGIAGYSKEASSPGTGARFVGTFQGSGIRDGAAFTGGEQRTAIRTSSNSDLILADGPASPITLTHTTNTGGTTWGVWLT